MGGLMISDFLTTGPLAVKVFPMSFRSVSFRSGTGDLPTMPDPTKIDPDGGPHLPTMPDPTDDPERGQEVPSDPDPEVKPQLRIEDPPRNEDDIKKRWA
jgi:hypothetical protein